MIPLIGFHSCRLLGIIMSCFLGATEENVHVVQF